MAVSKKLETIIDLSIEEVKNRPTMESMEEGLTIVHALLDKIKDLNSIVDVRVENLMKTKLASSECDKAIADLALSVINLIDNQITLLGAVNGVKYLNESYADILSDHGE